MSLWMITRVSGEEWTILDIVDDFYEVPAFSVHNWSVSFSYRMVLGLGPKIAPNCHEVPAYRNAPAYEMARISAYVGIPLETSDGQLFGILTGINPEPMGDELHDHLSELEFHANELMCDLESERLAAIQDTELRYLANPQWLQAGTGLLSMDAWRSDLLEFEKARLSQAEPNGIVFLRFEDETDENIGAIAKRIRIMLDEDLTIYSSEDAIFFPLPNRIRNRQQAVVRELKTFLNRNKISATCVHRYREPNTPLGEVFEKARHQAEMASIRKAA